MSTVFDAIEQRVHGTRPEGEQKYITSCQASTAVSCWGACNQQQPSWTLVHHHSWLERSRRATRCVNKTHTSDYCSPLCGRVAFEEKALAIHLQAVQVLQSSQDCLSILKLTEAKAFGLLGLRVMQRLPRPDCATGVQQRPHKLVLHRRRDLAHVYCGALVWSHS